jgi:hypothetical protein
LSGCVTLDLGLFGTATSHHGALAIQSKEDMSQQESHWDGELKDFEANRRSRYTAKLDSMKLFLNSYQVLLRAGLQEIEQAHRLVLGVSKAHQMLSNELKPQEEEEDKPGEGEIEEEDDPWLFASMDHVTDQVRVLFQSSATRMEEVDRMILEMSSPVQEALDELTEQGKRNVAEMEDYEKLVRKAWGEC